MGLYSQANISLFAMILLAVVVSKLLKMINKSLSALEVGLVWRDIYYPVLSQLNILISSLLFIQHIHNSFAFLCTFTDTSFAGKGFGGKTCMKQKRKKERIRHCIPISNLLTATFNKK